MKKITLTQGKFAKVDDSDYESLNKFKWHVANDKNNCYAARKGPRILDGGKQTNIKMHTMIMDTPSGFVIDHIDGDGLNNQRGNLRICTYSQNAMNRGKTKMSTSGFKGVFWHKGSKKWQAQIRLNKNLVHLGLFETKLEAYEVYCIACEKYHKEFSNIT